MKVDLDCFDFVNSEKRQRAEETLAYRFAKWRRLASVKAAPNWSLADGGQQMKHSSHLPFQLGAVNFWQSEQQPISSPNHLGPSSESDF